MFDDKEVLRKINALEARLYNAVGLGKRLRADLAAAEAENERLREVVSVARLLRGALFIDPRNGKVDIAMDGQAIKAVENIDSAFAELDAGEGDTDGT